MKEKWNKIKKGFNDIYMNKDDQEVKVSVPKEKTKKVKLPKISIPKAAKEKSVKPKMVSEESDVVKSRRVSRHSKKKKIIKNIIGYAILAIIVLVAIGGGLFFLYIANTAPKFNPNMLYTKEATILYDKDGNEFAKLGVEKRENVAFEDLPQVFIDALVSVEDSRYYQHNGFDLPRFMKATGGQILGNNDAGGASTLTMQVVKNTFTSTDQTIVRKFTDIYMAIFVLEKNYTKEEIMEFYVNGPYLGSGAYGVGQAAQVYFNKDIADLNLVESATIAGLFQAPGAYDPYYYPEKAEKRRNDVLYLMRRHGYISNEEYELATSIPVSSTLAGKLGQNQQISEFQGYIDVVVEEIIDQTDYNPYDTPMLIYTAMDQNKQREINKLLAGENYNWEDPMVQAGFTVSNINTGEVTAIGSGRDYGIDRERSYNYATMIERQPGSTAKPIFEYGPGIEFLNWSTAQMFDDAPYTYGDGKTPIKNWDGGYFGNITMRTALAESRNIPALKAFQLVKKAVGDKQMIDFIQGLGIKPEVSNGFLHEAHSIGGFNGVSPVEMGGAYAAFGNGGYYIKPHTVNKIVYREDSTEEQFTYEKKKAMKDSTAYMITNVLRTSASAGGMSNGASVPGVNVAAKTGTTNLDDKTLNQWNLPSYASFDIWMIGYDPEFIISMWYGYEKLNSDHYLDNGSSAYRNRLFKAVGNVVWQKNSGLDFKQPSSVVSMEVEFGSDPPKLPSASTPGDKKITELFVKGAEPTETSMKYFGLSNVTGLTASFDDSTKKIKIDWNYVGQNISDSTLGDLGYEVYLNGELKTFTKNNHYDITYNGSASSVTIMVKTSFENDRSITSSGSTVTVTVKDELKCLSNGGQIASYKLSVNPTMTLTGATATLNGSTITTGTPTIRWYLLTVGSPSQQKGTGLYPASQTFNLSGIGAGSYQLYYECRYQGLTAESNKVSITVTN